MSSPRTTPTGSLLPALRAREWEKRARAAEAALRDAQRVTFQADNIVVVPEDELIRERLRAEDAEAQVQQLQAALERVATSGPCSSGCADFARAALADVAEDNA